MAQQSEKGGDGERFVARAEDLEIDGMAVE
jgi:hypothetical protein